MATNPAVPFWDEDDTVTCHAETAVTGKRFVTVSGPMVGGNPQVEHQVGAAGKMVLGVAAYDAAAGAKVSVYNRSQVMPVTAGEAIVAGDLVYSAADGRAVKTPPAGALVAGIALNDAALGADCPVKLV